MADDDDDAREEDHEESQLRAARATRSRPRRRALPRRVFADSHGQPVVYVDRDGVARRRRVPARRAAVHECVDVTAVDHLVDAERAARRRRRAPSASRWSPTSCRTRATGASASIARCPADDPTVASHHDRLPGRRTSPSARLRPVRHRRSTATPTSRASSCPTTGSATRCARTTRRRACRSRSRATRARDDDRAEELRRRARRGGRHRLPSARCRARHEERRLERQTDEGAQQLRPLAGESCTGLACGAVAADDSTTR